MDYGDSGTFYGIEKDCRRCRDMNRWSRDVFRDEWEIRGFGVSENLLLNNELVFILFIFLYFWQETGIKECKENFLFGFLIFQVFGSFSGSLSAKNIKYSDFWSDLAQNDPKMAKNLEVSKFQKQVVFVFQNSSFLPKIKKYG